MKNGTQNNKKHNINNNNNVDGGNMIKAEDLVKLKNEIQVGEAIVMLKRIDPDEETVGRKLTKVNGRVQGKYGHYFSVQYNLNGHKMTTSYTYQELLYKKPLVFRRSFDNGL